MVLTDLRHPLHFRICLQFVVVGDGGCSGATSHDGVGGRIFIFLAY